MGIVLLLGILSTASQVPSTPNDPLLASQPRVLGEEEAKEANEVGENEQKEVEKNESEPESIKITTRKEGGKSEADIETADGQKVKTKVEDDGTSKIEIEHDDLKIKYEVRSGQVVTKVEREDGEEVEMEDDELDKLEDEVEDELEDDGIKISTVSAGQLTFAKNKIAATTKIPLSINIGTRELIITTPAGQKVVTVLPDQAVQNLLATGIIDVVEKSAQSAPLPNDIGAVNDVVKFEIKNGQPVYEIDGLKTYRLLAFIPVSRPVTAVVSSQTGQVVAQEKSFLTNVIDLLSP